MCFEMRGWQLRSAAAWATRSHSSLRRRLVRLAARTTRKPEEFAEQHLTRRVAMRSVVRRAEASWLATIGW